MKNSEMIRAPKRKFYQKMSSSTFMTFLSDEDSLLRKMLISLIAGQRRKKLNYDLIFYVDSGKPDMRVF
jgi:hypothetical protein